MRATSNCKFLVAFGDLHTGSTMAPCPEFVEMGDDTRMERSRVQDWLTDCWEHFCQRFVPSVVGREEYVVVNLGDSIEGDHHGGKQTITNDPEHQRELAAELIRMLTGRKNCKDYWGIAGTECHTEHHEEKLNEILGADACPVTGRFAPDFLDLLIRGCLTSFRHHIPTTTKRGMLASQLSSQLMEEQGVAAGSRSPVPRVVVRAHRHAPGYYTDFDGLSIVTPPWQIFTRHTHKVASAQHRSVKVGAYVIDYSGVEGPFDLPKVHEQIYRPTQ